MLNLTPDHLDRHASFADYATAKMHGYLKTSWSALSRF